MPKTTEKKLEADTFFDFAKNVSDLRACPEARRLKMRRTAFKAAKSGLSGVDFA
jgi:hypothetical protein